MTPLPIKLGTEGPYFSALIRAAQTQCSQSASITGIGSKAAWEEDAAKWMQLTLIDDSPWWMGRSNNRYKRRPCSIIEGDEGHNSMGMGCGPHELNDNGVVCALNNTKGVWCSFDLSKGSSVSCWNEVWVFVWVYAWWIVSDVSQLCFYLTLILKKDLRNISFWY